MEDMPARGEPAHGWTCPRCQRAFKSRNQWHSCDRISVEAFFGKHEALLPVFQHLMSKLARWGGVEAEAFPTSIHLGVKGSSRFAGVQLRKDHMRIGFLLERVLPDDPRIVVREPLGKTRMGHGIVVRVKADVDAQLLGWLREAYELRARR